VLGVFAVLNRLVEPLPPRRITFSAGREHGAYHTFAKEYARLAAADGFTVDILTGAGSVETLRRLANGQAMAGFVQGGTAEAAAAALETGRLDAAFFIMAPGVPLVRHLLLSQTVSLWSVRRTIAYTTRYRFLSTVTLGEGAVDLATNIPDRDVLLLAATATLVVREDVHPVIVRLLLKTAEAVHSRPGLFEAPNAFPSDTLVELPLHDVARRYLRKGPPFLQRYPPFWVALP